MAVIACGYVLTRTGDALWVQIAIGASFMGAIFLALATSLPE